MITHETSFEIVPFEAGHLEEAAGLFVEKIRQERVQSPLLPPRFEDTDTILPRLEKLSQRFPGVAAVHEGRLQGFMTGWLLESWRGRRSVCVPEWGHAEIGDRRVQVFNDMYENLGREWVADGCFTHLIGTLAHDREIIDALAWLGFGMAAVDAMRDMGEVQGPFADVRIRRACIEDTDIVMSLTQGQQRYMVTSPTFMALEELCSKKDCIKSLADPGMATWLASYHGEMVSYLRIGSASDGAAYVISDEKTASITAAFTQEHVRNLGIAASLLRRSLQWATSEGYERCAVDFEPENVLGRSFWLRHFQPVCFALIRQVDPRIAEVYKVFKSTNQQGESYGI
ncbi:GNAT family N-acetyltransferase [candidate division WOR-3 bacterium]|nr:GNAT family N-acetyltransferase [candidate division WOR-3 bacterium]